MVLAQDMRLNLIVEYEWIEVAQHLIQPEANGCCQLILTRTRGRVQYIVAQIAAWRRQNL